MSNLTNLKFKDGDEDGEETTNQTISIVTVSNGWIVTVADDDGELTEVYSFNTPEKILDGLREALGV